MKRCSLFVGMLFLSLLGYAQVDVLQVPNQQEKAQLTQQIEAYLGYLNKMSSSKNPEEKKTLTIPFMRDVLLKGTDVMTPNDLDTSGKFGPIKLLTYAYGLSAIGEGTAKHMLDRTTLLYEPLKYDKWRRFYYSEIKATKSISYYTLKPTYKIVIDSITNKADSTLATDTITTSTQIKLSFFFKFEKENGVSKNFRLMGAVPSGQMITLPPIGTLQTWWSELDAEWKTILLKMRTMEEYPKESDLERLTYQSELLLDNSNFKTFEPLAAFTNVKKLSIKNSTISSFEPLSKMTALIYLDISKSAIQDIKGIEKLTKLEEFYAVGNKLTSIQPLSSLVSLLKLDISENELEDITPVAELINLKELNISLNIKLKNIDAVKNLVNMEKLSFRKIEIKDLTPVQGMKFLVYLDCYNTGITSLEPIRNLQKIFHLDLSNNKVTSLEPIKNYQYLINLYLNSSSVADLSVVDRFYVLRELEIAACPQITSLGGIHKLEYIKVLKCFYTKIGKDEIQRFKKSHPNCAITYY